MKRLMKCLFLFPPLLLALGSCYASLGVRSGLGISIVMERAGEYANVFVTNQFAGNKLVCEQLTADEAPRCVYRPPGGFTATSVCGEIYIQSRRIGSGEIVGFTRFNYCDWYRGSGFGRYDFPVYRIREISPVVPAGR